MTNPKKAACPNCTRAGDDLGVYRYDNGWRHVECDGCHYLGPGAGSILSAIKLHNDRARGVSP